MVDVYEDAGISGSNGREKRPGLDRLLKDATARKINMIAAWSVDRLGRSLQAALNHDACQFGARWGQGEGRQAGSRLKESPRTAAWRACKHSLAHFLLISWQVSVVGLSRTERIVSACKTPM